MRGAGIVNRRGNCHFAAARRTKSLFASMSFLTGFGDLAVLLPVSAAILVWLLAIGAVASALRWLVAVGLCMGGIGLLKIYFFACPAGEALQSPSGHSGSAALVYGALAALLSAQLDGRARLALRIAGALLIAAIALSRLVLQVHTVLDVMAGLLVGIVTLAWFLSDRPGRQAPASALGLLTVGLVAILVTLQGQQLRAEGALHKISHQLKVNALFCPTRVDLSEAGR
jgi:membrane-associated phospholipid phosphatase